MDREGSDQSVQAFAVHLGSEDPFSRGEAQFNVKVPVTCV